MQDKRETADSKNPTAYQLGKMFWASGREYNPYSPDTENFTEFNRGKLDAEEESELAAEIRGWDYANLELRVAALGRHEIKVAGAGTGRMASLHDPEHSGSHD